MAKKLTAMLALIGLLMVKGNLGSSIKPIGYFQSPKGVVPTESNLEGQFKENKRRLDSLIAEMKWTETDEIYQKITMAYSTLDVPEYITRKFIRSLGAAESSDNPRAKSRMGARGWGQLTKDAWYRVEKSDYKNNVFNLERNISTTIKYILWTENLIEEVCPDWGDFPDDKKVELIAAAYNGGVKRLYDSGWDIRNMSDETKNYMPRIKEAAGRIAPNVGLF